MVRWDPGSRDKLAQAALELYSERGYERTTVAEIAERAGLTERTFFRHFADKREVLFGGSEELQQSVVDAVAGAPGSATPLEAAAAGLDAAGAMLQDRRPFSRARQAIIAASPELQERERVKLASLAAALAETLRGRGVAEPAASLAAEVAIGVFRIAFERWNEPGEERELRAVLRESLDELKAVAAG